MGKTIRNDAKYPNKLNKHKKTKKSKKGIKVNQKTKRYLKGSHLQRINPPVDEDNKGSQKI